MLAATLVDAQVDLNPHQVEAALFAFKSPLSKGVILADEVGLGKTIEAGLVIAQRWAERKRRILVVVPANLRKQWHQELQDKFSLQGLILEARNYRQLRKNGAGNPFVQADRVVICSYQFAKSKADDLKAVPWDLVVMDEAHRLRNVYKRGNVIGKTLKEALVNAPKVLLTATPLQNSLLELYGLVSVVDERVFGDLESFRDQFAALGNADTFAKLRSRLQPVCMRTLRRQVQPYISYTKRFPIVQDFTPSSDEQTLHGMVGDYLRRPSLNALPSGQRQLISLVLWKLLASSSFAIAGALGTMATRLEEQLKHQVPSEKLTDVLDEDYEALDQIEEEWAEPDADHERLEHEGVSVAEEIAELRDFQRRAVALRDNAKGQALLIGLGKAFAKLEELKAPRKALIFTESRRTQDYLLELLESSAYAGQTVLFNGTNSGEQARAIYKEWLARHVDTDRISGSRTADTRADSFGGSGTTGAVAHKMGRRWIMVELGEHCHTHIAPRLQKVIDGQDPGGVTQATGWQGGGGFRYYELAPTLLATDRWDNLVINPAYDAAMLAAAMCKLEGFAYAPSEVLWWQQGRSSERDFIYVTTQTLGAEQLAALSDEVGADRSLLVCCGAYRGVTAAQAAERWPNLTIKKIPKMVKDRCEWGHDDYSLNVANLPMAQKKVDGPGQDDLFGRDAS